MKTVRTLDYLVFLVYLALMAGVGICFGWFVKATVYRLPAAERSSRGWRIPAVPLTDCPLIVTDRQAVEVC